jgi:hypothetical protein
MFTARIGTLRVVSGDGPSIEPSTRVAALLDASFVPAPGIDAARAKGLVTWAVRIAADDVRTYFSRG